jgi:hypothetical protein
MKFLFALLLPAVFSSAAHAEAMTTGPSAIVCTSKATDKNVRTLTLTDLNTEEPKISLGLGLEDLSVGGFVSVGFSDECESSYSFSWAKSDLEDLRSGKVKSIKGMLNYNNPNLDEIKSQGKENTTETIAVDCRLK